MPDPTIPPPTAADLARDAASMMELADQPVSYPWQMEAIRSALRAMTRRTHAAEKRAETAEAGLDALMSAVRHFKLGKTPPEGCSGISQMHDRLCDVQADLAAARQRIVELEGALRPFTAQRCTDKLGWCQCDYCTAYIALRRVGGDSREG